VFFVFWEMKVATEPIIPMHLFRNSIFTVSNIIAFTLGSALMGTLIYISLYLQLVVGYSPTMAGLALLPMMLGVMPASIIGGRIISRIGKYRAFPIAGSALATVGMILMSRLTVQTGAFERGVFMFVLGTGLGLVMPVLTLAVQNSLPLKDIGTGTSSNLFFRNMGGSFGTAAFGAILTNRLSHYLTAELGAKASGFTSGGSATGISRASLATQPAAVQSAVLHSFVQSMSVVFQFAAVVMAIGFVFSLFLKQVTLRTARGPEQEGPAEGTTGDAAGDEAAATSGAAPALH
jgi:predicted MFS family arabinose efflux permease